MGKPADRGVLETALAKTKAGRELTQREKRAIAAWSQERRDQEFRERVQAVPQKWLREWIGRQTKQLQDVERRHGLPCTGRYIDLPSLLRALFDLLAEHAHRIPAKGATEPGFSEAESPALERKRAADADIAEMRRDELAGRLLSVEEVRRVLSLTAREIRRGIERLGRKHGPNAQKVIQDALDRALRQFDSGLSDDV